ncbi:DUF1015 domain-containing protein [Elusimicrobiota bacterium]
MSVIRPFNGVRFKGANISKFICPPYDVISSDEKKRLKNLSNNNMVKLELPDSLGTKNKYQQAAFLFDSWQKNNVMNKDDKPAFYFYEQKFSDNGKGMKRCGFLAALKLENPHGGSVKPHEKTLAKPKQDRLSMLRAVKANLSPIFGLFNDDKKIVVNICKKISGKSPDSVAKDKDGVSHKLWKVEDEKIIDKISKVLKSQKVFIADGHHRYETAWNYSQSRKKKNRKHKGNEPYNYVMIFLCPMQDKGLSIWPTHRVFDEPKDMEAKIDKYFNVSNGSKYKKLKSNALQPLLFYKKGKFRTLTLKNKTTLNEFMKGECSSSKNLGVSMLHKILLKGVSPEYIRYVKSEKEAIKKANSEKCVAMIVPATPMKALKEIATLNQTMPQKSTYFYPKVTTGMVLHSVK